MADDVEVVDTLRGEDVEVAECFGEWDKEYKDCTERCEIREMCKKQTMIAPPPVTEAPPLEAKEELPEMSPHEFLVESLNGRYEISTKMDGTATVINCKKDGKAAVQVRMGETGRYLFKNSKGDKIQLNKLESVRQASDLFKALLMV